MSCVWFGKGKPYEMDWNKAARDDAPLNQFIVMAVAEKISALNTEAFFQERARLSSTEAGLAALANVRTVPPVAGDER